VVASWKLWLLFAKFVSSGAFTRCQAEGRYKAPFFFVNL
jgi:hypothetical protein